MKKQKLYLIFHGRFPSEKAASLFVAHSARAFAQHVPVVVLAPRRLGREPLGRSEAYRLPVGARVAYLPTIDLFSVPLLRRGAFAASYLVFSAACFIYLSFALRKGDIVETNEWLPALLASFVSRNVVYEVHDFPERLLFAYRALFSRARFILVTNKWKAQEMREKFKVEEKKILIERNGVDAHQFSPREKGASRSRLGIPLEARVAVYTGHLYGWKGVDTLARAAAHTPDVLVYFVGGTPEDIVRFKEKHGKTQNIRIVGHRPHEEMPVWQGASDVLILPNTATQELSAKYTSPMKLFEYMASGRPIIASNVPSITEALPPEAAFLFEPDSPEALAKVVEGALLHEGEAQNRAVRARELVLSLDWKPRAQRLLHSYGVKL